MALVNVDLSCTGTGSASIIRDSSIVKSCIGTSVPKLLKIPGRSLQALGTAASLVSKLPGKVLTSQASINVLVRVLMLGVDTLDIVQVQRKWFVTSVGNWRMTFERRFRILVRGRPGG